MNLYPLAKLTIGKIFKQWVGTITGTENIPNYGSAIFAFNHSSYLDFLCFSSVLKRDIHFLAAEKFYSSRLWAPLMKATNQIKVDRHSDNKENVFKNVFDVLENGGLIGIFPEGTRSRSGQLGKAFNGIIKIALKKRVPIIPVGIIGSHKLWPPNQVLPKLGKIEINIGKKIHIDHFHNYLYDQGLNNKLVDHLMHNIADLSKQIYPWGFNRKLRFMEQPINHKFTVFFDVDNTLIKGQSQFEFIKYIKKKKYISLIKYFGLVVLFLLYKIHILPNVDYFRKVGLKVIKNWRVYKTKEVINNFFNEVLKDRIYKQAEELINEHKAKKHIVILFSTAWEEILLPLKEYLNVDYLISTKVIKNHDYFTGEVKGDAVYGHQKVIRAQQFLESRHLDRRNTFAYADHYSDSALLEFVNYPVVVNPDEKMEKLAIKMNWQILKFLK